MTMIATIGADFPHDLLAATRSYAGPLGWNLERPTPRADAWLESKFAPWARAILEDWAEGRLEHLDAVLFTRGDDNSHRLYYYICELRARGLISGPEPLVFDVARLPRSSSEAHTLASVRRLAIQFGVDDAALERGIVETNARRAASRYPATTELPLCLFDGTRPPDRRLHEAAEAVGWSARGETLTEQWQRLGDPVAEASGDPAAAIARQLFAESFGPRGRQDHAAATLQAARAACARAAVLWFTEEEEALVWHLPAQRRALEEAGLPVLTLVRRSWRADDGAGAEIAAFLKEVAA